MREDFVRPTLLSRLGFGSWVVDAARMRFELSETAQRLLQLPHGSVYPLPAAFQMIAEPHRKEVVEALERCLADGSPIDLEYMAELLPGRVIWVRLVGQAVRRDGRITGAEGVIGDMTPRKGLEERLQALRREVESVYESITDGFFIVDRGYRIQYLNALAAESAGLSKEEALGTSLWDHYPEGEHSAFLENYELAFNTGQSVHFEAYSPSQKVWFQIAAYPSEKGLAVYFQDVTNAHEMQAALAQREQEYRMLFESSTDAILETSPEGPVFRANKAACEMFGLTEGQICARQRKDFVAPEDTAHQEIIRERAATGQSRGRVLMMRGDGSRFVAEIATAQFTASDGQIRSVNIIRDITNQLRQEAEILELNTQLAEKVRLRTAQLESANQELTALAHALAHDLRAPIAAIDGFGGALRESLEASGTATQKRHAERVIAAGQQMGGYVDAVLAMASLSQQELVERDVNLSHKAEDILEALRSKEPGRSVLAHVESDVVVRGDNRLLRMVLENLLGNAWKFTSKVPSAEIRFGTVVAESGEKVYFVKDNGAGFDPQYAHKLFGSFQRLHTQSEFPGTGVGLSNVRRIIERHGGRVWAQSEPGQGATFYFTLGQLAS